MIRVLQLTPRVPWPPSDGGRVVMLQCARALHELGHEVEVLSLNPRRQHVDANAAAAALAPIPFEAVDIETSAVALRRSVPPLVARFYSSAFDALLEERLRAGNFDVVQIESPFLLPYAATVRRCSTAVVVLRSLNVEFRIWERLAERTTNAVRRVVYRAIARSLRRYEIAQFEAVDAVVPITEEDAAEFRALGCSRPMFVLPGGVVSQRAERALDCAGKASALSPAEENTPAVGFLGSLDYRPNQDAALWIADNLTSRLPNIQIAGSRAPRWLQTRLEESAVHFHGEVADATAFIEGMAVMIAPIFSGGGMRIKILEAMAAGKPVVATSIGAEGLEVTSGETILIADDADAFATAVQSLLADPERARAMGEAGRSLVNARYSAVELTRGLVRFYEELVQRAPVGGDR